MSPLVVTLVLSSAVMHAAWNLLARRPRSEIVFFRRMILVVVAVGLVPAAVSELLARSLSPTAWACVAGSGACCGVYFFCLARAYSRSDFTVVYPVARALPVLLVGLGDVLRGRDLTAAGWLGMLVVVGGCVLCPLHSFRDFRWRRYFNRASIYIVLTALGTVGYTLLDKVASETLAQTGPGTAARYGYVFFFVAWIVYVPLTKLFARHERHAGPASPEASMGWWMPALAAFLNFGGYGLVLWAYQMTPRAGYIVAFRQFSIVLGVVLAFAFYKEKGLAVRLTGAVLATAGLFIIGLWGG